MPLREPSRGTSRVLDEWLVLGAQCGDERAFGRLVERWQGRVLVYAYRLTGDRAGAADVAQDAWVGVARGIRRLEDPAAFRGWLFSIVRRRASDWVRARQRDRLGFAVAPGEAEESDAGDGVAVRRALALLDADERELLVLRHVEGLSVVELAGVLAVPVGTVKSRLFAARARLRALLESEV